MLDTEQVRKIVREEIIAHQGEWNRQFFEQIAPFRQMAQRVLRDIYGENPDGSRAVGGGLLDMTKRNNVLLWVVLALSIINFGATGIFILVWWARV